MGARQTRWLIIAVIALALTAAVIWLSWPKPVEVSLSRADRGAIAEAVSDQGLARVREAYVVAAPASGRLARIDWHVGDAVTANGSVLARIEPAAADLLDPRTRAQAEAGVAAALAAVRAQTAQQERLEAEAQRAEAALKRARTLADKGILARQALDDAEAAARSARAAARAGTAEITARRADLARARAALSSPEASGGAEVVVRSPVSGYVTRVFQESARTVAVGTPLIEISDSHGLEAAIEFLSQDAVRIREGMAAEVFDWGGEGVLPAIVRRIEPQGFTKTSALGVEEQRVLVLLQFTGETGLKARLGPGYRVWGRVILRREPAALRIPLGALVRSGGGWAVFRVIGGRARLTPIAVGALTDDRAEVREGLRPGDPVIVFPSDKVRDGVRVRPRNDDADRR